MKKSLKIIIAVALFVSIAGGGYILYRQQQNRANVAAQAERQSLSLQEAISLNNLDAVKFLVKNGADLEYQDVSATGGEGTVPNPEGFTALGWAMFTNRPEIARYLIEQGADVKASMPMESMLFWAIAFKMEDIAEQIIDKGGNISGANGYNAAAHAKILGLDGVVNKLAEKGINTDEPTDASFSAED